MISKEEMQRIYKKKDALMAKYPLLYGDRNKPMTQTCMCWGLDVDEGWLDLIDKLSEKIEVIIKQYLAENTNLPCEVCMADKDKHHLVVPVKESKIKPHDYYPSHPKASQVKEKYGGLRFYMTHGNQEIYDLIDEAENKSMKTCETCGEEGRLCSDHGWYKTLCERCVYEYNADGRNYKACKEEDKEEEEA